MLDSDVPGLSERPINIFLPRLFQVWSSCTLLYISIFLFIVSLPLIQLTLEHCLSVAVKSFSLFFLPVKTLFPDSCAWIFFEQFFQSPHATLRKLSLSSVNQYIMLMPTVSNNYVRYFVILHFEPCSDPYVDTGCYNIYDCRLYMYPWISIFKVYLFLLMTLRQKCESWLVLYSVCLAYILL